MEGGRALVIAVGGLTVLAQWLYVGQARPHEGEREAPAQAIRLDVTVKAREFRPSLVTLPLGQRVVLVFHNQDAELHAFVPKRFLEGVPVHVDGNGAAQFGDTGLERILIPSGGREEIHFVPATAGTFEYRCDLPGHQMVGKIVVENRSADRYMSGERRGIP
ncbi:MAG: hypothetical protein KatS3mg082_0779 [Nitrospiraceae bacterium]|nr:MAG: hypothetical protein KatS3mg082_0779 [Nitrospiraceae bacterium]